MTAILEQPTITYPVLHPVHAFMECARCYRIGRIEWLPDGTVRALHRGTPMCIIQLPKGGIELDRALFLLR